MTKWINAQVPTKYYDCKDYYIKDENNIVIVVWIPEHPDAAGEIVATIKSDGKPTQKYHIQYHDSMAAYDGLVQANIARVLAQLADNSYNFNKDKYLEVINEQS